MRQTILTVILIVLILAGGYVWFTYYRQPQTAVPAVSSVSGSSERLAQYRHLKNLKPDMSIFSDPLFKSLTPAASGGSLGITGPSGQPSQMGRTNPLSPFE